MCRLVKRDLFIVFGVFTRVLFGAPLTLTDDLVVLLQPNPSLPVFLLRHIHHHPRKTLFVAYFIAREICCLVRS